MSVGKCGGGEKTFGCSAVNIKCNGRHQYQYGFGCAACNNTECGEVEYRSGACEDGVNGFECTKCSYIECPEGEPKQHVSQDARQPKLLAA